MDERLVGMSRVIVSRARFCCSTAVHPGYSPAGSTTVDAREMMSSASKQSSKWPTPQSGNINRMPRRMGTLMDYLKGNTRPKGHGGEAANTWIKYG